MPKPVPLGVRHELQETVALEHTLSKHHPTLPPVLSTPEMIRLMETACFFALQPFCEGDEITVGAAVNVEHRTATPLGASVHAEAVLETIDGRFYIMRVRAWDGQREIGRGTVHRAFVSVGKFLARAQRNGNSSTDSTAAGN